MQKKATYRSLKEVRDGAYKIIASFNSDVSLSRVKGKAVSSSQKRKDAAKKR